MKLERSLEFLFDWHLKELLCLQSLSFNPLMPGGNKMVTYT